MKVRYVYDYVPVHGRYQIMWYKRPVACIVKSDNKIGIACFNPNDQHFLKKYARNLAKERSKSNLDWFEQVPNRSVTVYTGGYITVKDNTVFYPYIRIPLKEACEYVASRM
jgi:hypothetical protein